GRSDRFVQRRDPDRGRRDLRGRAARPPLVDVHVGPLLAVARERRASLPRDVRRVDGDQQLMMKMKPASDAWVKAFDAALADERRVERRKMFGYPAAFVGGNMAAGLHQDGLVLRLGDADRDELLRRGGRPFEPMPGRVMSGFALAPQSFVKNPSELRAWLDRSICHAASMPAKKSAPETQPTKP